MSLGGLWRKENGSYHTEGAEDREGGKDDRRRSRRPSLSPFKKFNWATGIVQRSLTAAAVVAKDLFTDLDGDSYIEDHYGELYVKRGLNQRADFEARSVNDIASIVSLRFRLFPKFFVNEHLACTRCVCGSGV